MTISFAGAKPVASIGVSAMLDPDDPDADEGALHGAAAVHGRQLRRADGELLAADELEAALHEPGATRSRRSRRGRWRRT